MHAGDDGSLLGGRGRSLWGREGWCTWQRNEATVGGGIGVKGGYFQVEEKQHVCVLMGMIQERGKTMMVAQESDGCKSCVEQVREDMGSREQVARSRGSSLLQQQGRWEGLQEVSWEVPSDSFHSLSAVRSWALTCNWE